MALATGPLIYSTFVFFVTSQKCEFRWERKNFNIKKILCSQHFHNKSLILSSKLLLTIIGDEKIILVVVQIKIINNLLLKICYKSIVETL